MNTLPDKKSGSQTVSKARYEFNLAEFPVAVFSKRLPKDLKFIEYEDTISGKDGKLVPRTWKVKPSVEYGFGSNQTLSTLFELFQIWKEQGFKSDKIVFGSVSNLVKRLGLEETKTAYERVRRDLNALRELSIEAKNAFWDNEKGAYGDKNFALFQDLTLYRKEGPRGQQILGFAYIHASEALWGSVQSNALFSTDFAGAWFHSLSPTAQRLAIYLSKMLHDQSIHRRELTKLAEQIPLYTQSYKKIKQTLSEKARELLETEPGHPLLQAFDYEKRKNGKGENIVFYRKDAKRRKSSNQETDTKSRASRSTGKKKVPEFSPKAQELVCYFYQRLHGITDPQVQTKEVAQAEEMISTHGLAKARHIVDFAYQTSQETNERFKPAVFSGLSSLVTRALADYDQYEKGQKRRKKEQTRQLEQERREQEAWERDEELLAQLSSEEQEQLFREAKEEVLSETSVFRRDPDNILVTESAKAKVIQKLRERFQNDDFTEDDNQTLTDRKTT